MSKKKQYEIKLMPSAVQYAVNEGETLLESAINNKIYLEHSCKNGACGICEVTVLDGSGVDNQNVVLSCQYVPISDMIIKADYFPELEFVLTKTCPAKINSVEFRGQDIAIIELRIPPTTNFNFLPGQYLDIKYQGVSRSYSIASIPNDSNTLELHLKKVINGVMSSKIFEPIRMNQLIQIEGPKGTFFLRNKATGPIIFIATGTGFAPVKAMLNQLIEMQVLNRSVHIYWGNRTSDLFYDQSLLLAWEDKYDFINVNFCLSKPEDEWSGRNGYVQNCVLEDKLSLKDAEVYACGSIDMISSAKELLINAGLNKEYFYSDAFVAS